MNGSTARMLHLLRQAKHFGFVVLKRTRRALRPARNRLIDVGLQIIGRIRPYRFEPARYPGSFVTRTETAPHSALPLPRSLVMFWFGDAAMPETRRLGAESIRRLNPGLEVRLLTAAEIAELEVPGFPFHSALPYLALTHQTDYLRCYLMHMHGGGYVDVKTIHHSWEPAFDRLAQAPEKWALGYRELSHSTATALPGAIQDDLRRNFFRVIGNGAYIMRPRTPLTAEWFAEVHSRLDKFEEAVREHPGGVYGGEEDDGYPVPKHALLGDILGPLALKYHERLIIDDSIRPSFVDYR